MIIVDDAKCTGCGSCVGACPSDALVVEGETVKVNDECIDCGVCADECPTEALSL